MLLRERRLLGGRWDRTPGGLMYARVGARPVLSGEPVVVLVHGFVISSLYMVPTAVRLAPHFAVLAPDLPGFGRSPGPRRALTVAGLADALAGWLTVLGLEHAVLVGNSLGCQVIAELAYRHRYPMLGAVLAGPTVDPAARTGRQQFARLMQDWPREAPSIAAAQALDYGRAGLGRAWGTLKTAIAHPMERRLPYLTAPTLVVRGSEDPLVPDAWARRVTALLPQGRLHVMPGAPHAVNYSAADRFAPLVADFVRSLGPPPGA